MAEVPRELFVPERLGRRAYADSALPIGDGQTISQPWIVAAICQGARARRRTSACSRSAPAPATRRRCSRGSPREVITIERVAELAEQARRALAELGVTNVEVGSATAARGCPTRRRSRRSPSTPPRRPRPQTLIAQLRRGGRLVVPIAERRRRHADRVPAGRERIDPDLDARRDRALPLRAPDRDEGYPASDQAGAPRCHGGLYALNFFSAAFVDQLKRGRKTATIRLGDKSRKYKRGQVVWVTVGYQHSPREKIFAAVIDDVEVKRVQGALAARHRARQPRVPPPRGDDQLPRADLRPRRSPRTTPSPSSASRRSSSGPAGAPARQRRDARRATDGRTLVTAEYRFLTTWLLEAAARAGLGRDLRLRALARSGGGACAKRERARARRRERGRPARALRLEVEAPLRARVLRDAHDAQVERARTCSRARPSASSPATGRWRLFEQDGRHRRRSTSGTSPRPRPG